MYNLSYPNDQSNQLIYYKGMTAMKVLTRGRGLSSIMRKLPPQNTRWALCPLATVSPGK